MPRTPEGDNRSTGPPSSGNQGASSRRQRRGGAAGRYGRWTPPGPAGRSTSLLVPVGRAFPDSDDLLAEALHALSRGGTPGAREIVLALARPGDEVRWWRETPAGPADAAPWSAERHLRAAAHRTLLAAALATRARAAYHGARHRRAAAALLEDVLVGPASGGRGLTAFVPVTPGRPLAVRLHQALRAAREAIDRARATGGTHAFDEAVEAGVSHELTEALAALVQGTQGARVAVAWAPAAGVPEGCSPGADVPHVRTTLDEEAYRIAGHAHLMGLPVRVHGRLESRGGFRRLTGAGGVAPVRLDDAERDRLTKALQADRESPASSRDACPKEAYEPEPGD
ncbi:hypothetical protein [Streptomyces cyaneogriseus]|uniref:hypothetical protein n=1 Tax=Streptomyces cyaneogriseus TaxID=68192 RepID=UPI0005C9A1EE